MTEVTVSLIEEYLERTVGESERASIRNLNEVPDPLLQTMRASPRPIIWMRAPRVLRFFVAVINEEQALSFADEVIAKGDSATGWRNGCALYFQSYSSRDAHSVVVADLKASLEKVAGERFFCRRGERLKGTIGVLVRNHRYWHCTPFRNHEQENESYGVIHAIPGEDLVKIEERDFECEMRRRMATDISVYTRLASTSECSVDSVIAGLRQHPGIGATAIPSNDGLISIRALVKEARSGSPDFPLRAGFIGPDDWYR